METIKVCNFKTELIDLEVENLTKTQRKYVEAIETYKNTYKKVPTIREIGDILGKSSPATVNQLLHTLILKGYTYNKLIYEEDIK